MKTILLISRCPPYPLRLGDRLIIWHLARELAGRGYVIDLLALYDREDDPRHIDQYRQFFRHIELCPEPRRTSLEYLRRLLRPASRFASAAKGSFSPSLWRAIAGRLHTHDYDLVHCFGSVSVYEYHGLFAHLPNLITPYESNSLYLRSAAAAGQLGARLRLPIARRFEAFMFTPFQRVVVISEVDRGMLLELQPSLNVEVIPNGIELERFRPLSVEREPFTLLFVGNFEYPPNQEAARLLLDAILPRVVRELPAARLQLVGFNPPAWLRERANERIEVTGAVDDVAPYLARASVFVCPLRTGAGLKNKVLEALAMGIPVIATPLSFDGIAISDGESAIAAELGEMPDQVVKLLHDRDLRSKLSRGGRRLIEARYNWAQVADSYERLYEEICQLRPRG